MAILGSNFDPTTTPPNQSTKVAIISYLDAGTRTAIGVTKGGGGFKPGIEKRGAQYDGQRHRVSGTSETVGFGASIDATVAEFSPKTTGIFLPGGTTAGGIVTPRLANLALEKGDMLELVWYQIPLKGGESLVYEFDLGEVDDFTIDTKDKDEATAKITILAYVDGTRVDYSSDLPDFRMFRLDANGDVIS